MTEKSDGYNIMYACLNTVSGASERRQKKYNLLQFVTNLLQFVDNMFSSVMLLLTNT